MSDTLMTSILPIPNYFHKKNRMASKNNNNLSDNPIYDLLFYIFVFGLSLSTIFFGNLKATFTLAILVLVWLVDVAIKTLAGIKNSTLYADLCFVALVFVSTSIPNKLIGEAQPNQDEIVITFSFFGVFWIYVAVLGLFFLWLINIRLCHVIEKIEDTNSKREYNIIPLKIMSAIIALASTVIVLAILVTGVL